MSAAFDALSIIGALEHTANGAMAAEIHAFAYLACLMALYESREPNWWMYGFTATPAGAPYAVALAEECDRLRAAGRVVDRGAMLALSVSGRLDRDMLQALRSCAARRRYVEAACGAASLWPVPAVTAALSMEPQLRTALQRDATRQLMQPAAVVLLRDQFLTMAEMLRQQSSYGEDLLVPTSVWLTYLARSSSSAIEDAVR